MPVTEQAADVWWRKGAAYLVAAVFGAAALAKLWDPRALQLQLDAVLGVPVPVTALAASVLPVLELVLVILVLVPQGRQVGLTHAWVLAAGFTGWQIAEMVGGVERCGCFGSWLSYPPVVGVGLDIGLVAAAMVAARHGRRAIIWSLAIGAIVALAAIIGMQPTV